MHLQRRRLRATPLSSNHAYFVYTRIQRATPYHIGCSHADSAIMASLHKIILLFTLLRVYCCIAGELLVFPEGEVHSIICTAPDEERFVINWGTAAGGVIGNEGTYYTVGDEEPVTNGTKGRRLMFTASPEVNGTILRCVVINFDLPSDSPEPLEFTIIIQGLLINLWVVVLETLNRHPGGS